MSSPSLVRLDRRNSQRGLGIWHLVQGFMGLQNRQEPPNQRRRDNRNDDSNYNADANADGNEHANRLFNPVAIHRHRLQKSVKPEPIPAGG